MLSERVRALEPSIIRQMANRRKPTSVNLSLGQPALAPDDGLLDRAWAKLRAGDQGYTHNAGLLELREGLARRHGFPGRAQAENAIVTVGSEEAVFLAMTAMLDPGDHVLVPDPGYPAYRGIAQLLGAEPVPYAVGRETGLTATFEAIDRARTERTRALVLNTPSNPFGTSQTEACVERLARLAEREGWGVVSDEIYRDLHYGAAPPPTICTHTDRSVFVSGFSKSCAMTGLRLGYLIADEAFVAKATLAHQLMVTCAPRLAQLAALEVLERPELTRAHVPYYARARAALLAARDRGYPCDIHVSDGAFYAILDVSPFAKGDPLQLAIQLAEEEDVIVVPGTAFGESGDWFWRLSYASGEDTVVEGLRRIERFLESRRR